jgi:hypothetical protein
MSHTDVSIASKALGRIGADSIASFSDGTLESDVAGEIYDDILESLLSERKWSFARGQAKLVRLTAVPESDWDYAYQIPTNIPVLVINRITQLDRPISYERMADKIHTNALDDLVMTYTFRPDAINFPPYFTEVLINELASVFAQAIARNDALSMKLEEKAQRKKAISSSVASQESSPTRIRATRLINRRH